RAFLRNSAVGIGSIAEVLEMCSGLKTEVTNGRRPGLAAIRGHEDKLGVTTDEKELRWGSNSLVLKSPWNASPSLDELLTDRAHTVSLSSFYRVGGENRSATPTEWRLAYNGDTLFVLFRCQEGDMSFPAMNQDVDWYSMEGLPAGSELSTPVSSPCYPDEVDF